MLSNYGGLNWDSNTFVYDVGNYTNLYGNSVTFPSDPNAVYNGFGALTINVTSPSAIILGDASFLGWGASNSVQSYTSTTVSVEGFLNGNPVGTWSTALSTTGFTDLIFGGAQVNAFAVTSSGDQQWWLMDNLTFNAATTPLPAALPLFATGLGASGLLGWRRKRKAAAIAA